MQNLGISSETLNPGKKFQPGNLIATTKEKRVKAYIFINANTK